MSTRDLEYGESVYCFECDYEWFWDGERECPECGSPMIEPVFQ